MYSDHLVQKSISMRYEGEKGIKKVVTRKHKKRNSKY